MVMAAGFFILFHADKYGVPNGTLFTFSLVFFTNMLSLTGQKIFLPIFNCPVWGKILVEKNKRENKSVCRQVHNISYAVEKPEKYSTKLTPANNQ